MADHLSDPSAQSFKPARQPLTRANSEAKVTLDLPWGRNDNDYSSQAVHERMIRFVSEASLLLSSTHDYKSSLSQLVHRMVPALADWCAIDLFEKSAPTRIAWRTIGEKDAVLAQDLDRLCKWQQHEIPTVTTIFQPEEISESFLPGLHQTAKDLGLSSFLSVPLVTEDGVFGVIFLAFFSSSGSGHSGRRFGSLERLIGEELNRFAGRALQNAKLAEESREAIRSRDEFLAVASHELRTPVTSLKVLIQLLRKMATDPDFSRSAAADSQRILESSEQQIDRLAKLIQDLLDVSGINRGQLSLELEYLDLRLLVEEVVRRYQGELDSAQCPLEIVAGPGVSGSWDRTRIEQVVSNLLGNAIKYAKGSSIRIFIEQEGGIAMLRVQDHGAGIAKEQQLRIFDRFERAISSKKIRGLGLGLYIVRQIVEAHSGRIEVKSEPGIGSTFTVYLPVHD